MKAVYAGSFDPPTLGHLDLILRSVATFGEVVIGVGINARKKPLFSTEERIKLIEDAIVSGWDVSSYKMQGLKFPDIRVTSFEGLLIDFCHLEQASVIVRGLRAVSDFEAEMAIADANHTMASNINTVFFPTRKEHTFISSSTVKEMASHPSATSWLALEKYVPLNVLTALRVKMAKNVGTEG